MRVLAIIFLIVCYLIPVSGFTLTSHYCGGKLSSVSSFISSGDKCKCGNKPMAKNCCKDKKVTFKIKDSHNVSKVFSSVFNTITTYQSKYLVIFNTFTLTCGYNINYFSHPPPLQKKQPLFLSNQTFLI